MALPCLSIPVGGMLSQSVYTLSSWVDPLLVLCSCQPTRSHRAPVTLAIFFEASLGCLPDWSLTESLGQRVAVVTRVERMRVDLSLISGALVVLSVSDMFGGLKTQVIPS